MTCPRSLQRRGSVPGANRSRVRQWQHQSPLLHRIVIIIILITLIILIILFLILILIIIIIVIFVIVVVEVVVVVVVVVVIIRSSIIEVGVGDLLFIDCNVLAHKHRYLKVCS